MHEEIKRWIPISECQDGYLYRIVARNGGFGIYNAENKSFTLSRFKFGDNFTFPEDHWDTGEPYGTVKPLEKMEEAPKGMDDNETLAYLNAIEKEHGSGINY